MNTILVPQISLNLNNDYLDILNRHDISSKYHENVYSNGEEYLVKMDTPIGRIRIRELFFYWDSCIGRLYLSPKHDGFKMDDGKEVDLEEGLHSEIWMIPEYAFKSEILISVRQNFSFFILSISFKVPGNDIRVSNDTIIHINKESRVFVTKLDNSGYKRERNIELENIEWGISSIEIHSSGPYLSVARSLIFKLWIDNNGKLKSERIFDMRNYDHPFIIDRGLIIGNKYVARSSGRGIYYVDIDNNMKLVNMKQNGHISTSHRFKGILFIKDCLTIMAYVESGSYMKCILRIDIDSGSAVIFPSVNGKYLFVESFGGEHGSNNYIYPIPLIEGNWDVQRVLWIGILKEQNSQCCLSILPKDVLKCIIPYITGWSYCPSMMPGRRESWLSKWMCLIQ